MTVNAVEADTAVPPPQADKTFEAGFFSVQSPVRLSPSPRVTRRSAQCSPRQPDSRASRSPLLLIAALNRSARKSSCVTPVSVDVVVCIFI